jgi:hypothetical protein
MTPTEVTTIVHALCTTLRGPLREELREDIRAQIEAYRRGMFVRSEWCCTDMVKFAKEVWNAAQPKPAGHFGSVAYQLRGRNMNFCPFCGISCAAPNAEYVHNNRAEVKP